MDGSIKVEETPAASGGACRGVSLRNIALLAMCQALTQSSNTLMFASSALAVLTIVSPDMRMWANLPVTMQHLGVMLSVFPASMLMMRRGRKFGFRTGSVMGMVGASLRGHRARHRQFPGDVPGRPVAWATPSPTCSSIASPPSNWRPATFAPRRSPT